MADLIGEAAALKVREEFGGLVISIPKLDGVQRKQRDDTIKTEYDSGVKVGALARKYNLTIRQIYNILGAKP